MEQKHNINISPISLPDPDLAWQLMQKRLDEDLPQRKLLPFTQVLKAGGLGFIFMLCFLILADPIIPKSTVSESSKAGKLPNARSSSSTIFQTVLEQSKIKLREFNRKTVKLRKPITPITKQTETTAISDPNNGVGNINTQPDSTLKLKQQDSTKKQESATKESEEKEPEKKWKVSGGLSWELQIPTTGVNGYFDGPSTTSQPWRILIPSIFAQFEQEKKLLTIELNPMFTNMVPEKTFRILNDSDLSNDTLVTRQENRALYKMFGLSLGIGYMKNISANWWLGGNFQSVYWTEAIARADVEQQQKVLTNGQTTNSSFQSEYQINEEWERFNKFQIFLYGEALYKKPKWQTGIRAGLGVTPVANDQGIKNPFRASLFYRRTIFGSKNEPQNE